MRARAEFLQSVTHELKTPITSIKGFVETLLDGAVDDPADARRFLEITGRHADNFAAIDGHGVVSPITNPLPFHGQKMRG